MEDALVTSLHDLPLSPIDDSYRFDFVHVLVKEWFFYQTKRLDIYGDPNPPEPSGESLVCNPVHDSACLADLLQYLEPSAPVPFLPAAPCPPLILHDPVTLRNIVTSQDVSAFINVNN